MVAAGDLAGRDLHAFHFVAHVGDHGLQVDVELVQRARQIAQFTGQLPLEARREVACGHLVGEIHGLFHGAHHQAAHEGRGHERERGGGAKRRVMHGVGHAFGGAFEHLHQKCEHEGDRAHPAAQGRAGPALQCAAPTGAHHPGAVQRDAGSAALGFRAHALVQRFGFFHLLACRFGAHRHVAHGLTVFNDRCGVRQHPVVIAVLAPVLHHGRPGRPALQRGPHVAEGLGGHVGVAHDVVRLAEQFLAAVAADRHEIRIAVGDVALQIGGGDERDPVRNDELLVRDGQIGAHVNTSKG